ncbi:Putative uncharacterized protein [Lacticaseibacillus paracasei]|nr:Putative uncharacterized protein [Lacticaseibacillus paracasei]
MRADSVAATATDERLLIG